MKLDKRLYSYAKNVIDDYPAMKARASAGEALTPEELREISAVDGALQELRSLDNRKRRADVIAMLHWQPERCTLAQAAEVVRYSTRVVARWHSDFVQSVARRLEGGAE